jgi:hypothetical protein
VRDIAHGFFEASPAMAGPLVALVLFFLVFVAASWRVLRARPSDFDGAAALPLDAPPPTQVELEKGDPR